MDLDGDGRRDVISGSWPGPIHLFRGTADGGLEKPVTIPDRDGKDLKLGNASVAFAADWDGDGDLDLIVGNIDGQVFLVPNEAGPGKPPVFGMPVPMTAGRVPIVAPGRDAGPCVADWDGDGRLDLLVGTGEGRVLFFRRGEGGALAAGMPLECADGPVRVEHRAKIAVADWNGDGALDLIVGDFSWVGEGQNHTAHGNVRVYLREGRGEAKLY